MTERALSNNDVLEMDKDYDSKQWVGVDRRKAHNSCIDPLHDRRKTPRKE